MNYLSVIKELKSLCPTVWPKIQHNSALTELALDSLPHDCSVYMAVTWRKNKNIKKILSTNF